MTSDSAVNTAKEFASDLEKIEGVESASVDDWGRDNNFQACVTLEGNGARVDADLRSVTPRIQNIASNNTHIWLEEIHHPEYAGSSKYSEKSTWRDGRVSMIHYRVVPVA